MMEDALKFGFLKMYVEALSRQVTIDETMLVKVEMMMITYHLMLETQM